MTEKPTGGPAFPSPADHKAGWNAECGMTLRDWFAGQALTGLIAQTDRALSAAELARQSYVCADAMIKAREQ